MAERQVRVCMRKMLRQLLSSSLLLVILMAMSSCVPSAPKGTKKSNGASDGNSVTNSGPGSGNFLQEGSQQTTSSLILAASFNDSFYLRGDQINSYIAQVPSSSYYCLVSYYPSSTDKKVLVLAAQKNFFNNYSMGSLEYYFKMFPQNKVFNQDQCLTAALTNTLNTKYGTTNFAFKIEDVCPGCSLSLNGQPLLLYTNSGSLVPQINLNTLSIQISNTSLPVDQPNACSSDGACQALSYDCCLQGQCVSDSQVKSGVSLSDPNFLAAQFDVQNNPAAYTSYPEYYYVCPSVVGNDDEEEVVDTVLQQQLHFAHLKDL